MVFGDKDGKLGRQGDPQDIRARSARNLSDEERQNLLAGCMENGIIVRVLSFVQGYLDFCTKQQTLPAKTSFILNEGLEKFAAAPLLSCIGKAGTESFYKALSSFVPDKERIFLILLIAQRKAATAAKWADTAELLENACLKHVGENGLPDEIRAQTEALFDPNHSFTAFRKLSCLLHGCNNAFEEQKPENLRAFIQGYSNFRQGRNAVLDTQPIDNDYSKLLALPLYDRLLKSEIPGEILKFFTRGMTKPQSQALLDVLLRFTCARARPDIRIAEATLQMGADSNAGGGRPLYNAIRARNAGLIDTLCRFNADPRVIPDAPNPAYLRKHGNLFNTVVQRQAIKVAQAGSTTTVSVAVLPKLTLGLNRSIS